MTRFAVDTSTTIPRATLNGVPFFVRGVYDQWIDAGTAAGHIATRADFFSRARLTHYLHFQFGDNDWSYLQLAALAPFGMYGFGTGNAFGSADVTTNSATNGGFDLVENTVYGGVPFRTQFNNAANSGGVYLADEVKVNVLPDMQAWHVTYNADVSNSPTFLALLPNGPITTNSAPNPPGYREVTDGNANVYWWAARTAGANDWLGLDPYPIWFSETKNAYGYPHFGMADCVAHSVAACTRNGKVPVIVYQLFRSTSDSRFINVDELWTHQVMGVVEGAKGTFWWQIGRGSGLRIQPDADRLPAEQALVDITVFFASIESLLVSNSQPSKLVGNSTSTGNAVTWRRAACVKSAAAIAAFNFFGTGGVGGRLPYEAEVKALDAGDTSWSPMLDQDGDVRTRVWEDADGIGYVFAYNYNQLPLTGVTLTWHQALSAVEVIGESRTITPAGAAWTDNFGGSTSLNDANARCGHIYKLTPSVAPPAPTPTLSVSPTTLAFSAVAGDPATTATVGITNPTGGTLTWSVTDDAAWLGVSPASGTGAADLTVTATPGTLAAGTYTGTITITATGATGSPATVSVTLTLAARPPDPPPPPLPPQPSIGVNRLDFACTAGGPVVRTLLEVDNPGDETVFWSIKVQQEQHWQGGKWLSVRPSSGIGDDTVTVRVDPKNLTEGVYTGTLVLRASGDGGSPPTVVKEVIVSVGVSA